MRNNSTTYRLAIDSMMASLYFVLAYFAIKIGNITITPASITIVLVSLLYSPQDAILVGLVGETINQMAKYGPSPTTVLWLIPVILRASIISFSQLVCRRKGTYLERHLVLYFLIIILAGLVTTAANTGIIFLDGYLMNYPVSYTLLETLFRFLSSLITCVLVGILVLPVMKAIGKLDIKRVPYKEKSQP
jgi:uncharacterized membrane protein